jgi:hypothetical protein
MGTVELRELGDHRRGPKGAQVVRHASNRLLIGEPDAIGSDLTGHPGQGLDTHG